MNKSTMNNPSSAQQDGKPGSAIVEQAKKAVGHVASDVAGQAREQVNTQFDAQKDRAVETIGNVATAIRETGDKLKGVGPLGDVAGRAADGIESVAQFFEGKKITDIVRDVERFARREPALFLGATFALGLIGGRFLKSSAHRAQSSNVEAGGGRGGYESDSASYREAYLANDDLEEDEAPMRGGTYGAYGSQTSRSQTAPMGSSGFGMGSSTPAKTPPANSTAPTTSAYSSSTSSSPNNKGGSGGGA